MLTLPLLTTLISTIGVGHFNSSTTHSPALAPSRVAGPLIGELDGKPYVYYKNLEIGGRVVQVVFGNVGSNGVIAPSEARIKEAALKPEVPVLGPPDVTVPGNELFRLESGWVGVRAAASGAAIQAPSNEQSTPPKALNLTLPWVRLVLFRSIATGFYSSEYYASSTPDTNRPEGFEQLEFSVAGDVRYAKESVVEETVLPVGERARAQMKTSGNPWEPLPPAGFDVQSGVTPASDTTGFIAECQLFMTKVIERHVND